MAVSGFGLAGRGVGAVKPINAGRLRRVTGDVRVRRSLWPRLSPPCALRIYSPSSNV